MNERIRQLADEAGLDWHTHWNDDESNRLEKFAELIVGECISIAQAGLAPAVVTVIKERFGVEE